MQEEQGVEIVLIDKFIVPEESKSAFLEATRKVQRFLRTLSGFVEGFVYEKTEGESRHNVLTTAVWENEEVFADAKKAAAAEFQKLGFNPQELMKKLNIEIERAVYSRSPY
jgi:heme-degrading monooxygenase HmoA